MGLVGPDSEAAAHQQRQGVQQADAGKQNPLAQSGAKAALPGNQPGHGDTAEDHPAHNADGKQRRHQRTYNNHHNRHTTLLPRITYYAHFTDPYDQLQKLEADIMVDMTIYVDSIATDGLHDDKKQQQIIKSILGYIQSKKHVFQVLLGSNGDANFERNLLTFFGERIFHREPAEMKLAYHYIYASTGSFGLIYYWIMDDNAVDVDTMAQWITSFNTPHI